MYVRGFLRLVAIGTLYGVDDFAFQLSLVQANGSTGEAPATVPDGVVTAYRNFWATTQMISQHAELKTLKLNEIGPDGRYVSPDTVLYDFDPPVTGSAGNSPPPQVSYVVSTQTAIGRGRAHAGRFYLPLPAATPGTAGVLSQADVVVIMEATTTLLKAINTAMAPDWVLGVVSNLGSGTEHHMTTTRYGQVLDTVRSRRNKFEEKYLQGPAL